MKSFKELIAVQYPSQLVEYDQRKPLHRDALKRLVFDFLDIETGDDESDKYLNNAKAYLLEKQGSYVAFSHLQIPETETASSLYSSVWCGFH